MSADAKAIAMLLELAQYWRTSAKVSLRNRMLESERLHRHTAIALEMFALKLKQEAEQKRRAA